MKLDTLFSPMKIGSCEIPNRLVVPAMVTNYCNLEGTITERYLRYMEEKARGGWGLLITEDYCVQENRKGYTRIPGLWNDGQIEGNKDLTAAVHAHGSKIFCQMYHPGRQVMPQSTFGLDLVAPSATTCPACQGPARDMTIDEIATLVDDFGSAAGRAKEAGFDGIELHCAHGYLLAEFLSPAINRRVDQYGGCFANRVRIVDEIIVSMRERVGEDFPIIVRVSSDDLVPGGRTIAETLQLCRHLEEVGFDAINCSNGMYASKPTDQVIAPMFTPHAVNMDRCALIKQVVNIPVILSNRVNDPEMADTLLAMGTADFVAMGRGSLADPHMPNKAKAGKTCTIRQCIGCLQGCEFPLYIDSEVTCLVNPRVGREYEDAMDKVETATKVMVIGAGPAGMSCAYYLANKGYPVTVFDRNPVPGGMLTLGIPSFRLEKDVLNAEIDILREMGVEFRCGVEVGKDITNEQLRAQGYKGFYVAIGAQKSAKLRVPGEELEGVYGGVDFLPAVNLGEQPALGKRCAVIGGGNVAMDVCRSAVRLGADETYVLYRRSEAELPADPEEVKEAMEEGVQFRFLTAPVEILGENGKVTGIRVERMALGEPDEKGRRKPVGTGEFETIAVDSVIGAIGQTVDWGTLDVGALTTTKKGTAEADALTYQTAQPDIFVGGDCYTGPKFAIDAIAAGKEAAISLHRYVHPGQTLTAGRDRRVYKALDKAHVLIETAGFDKDHRQMPGYNAAKAKTFSDARVTFTEEQVRKECARCLGCGATKVDSYLCIGCGLCTTKCKFDAIHLKKVRDWHAGSYETMPIKVAEGVVKRAGSIVKKAVSK